MNIGELSAEMARQRISIPELAIQMKVSKKLLYSRFKGETSFKHEEICKIISILGLNEHQVLLIFFNEKVS